MKKKMLLICAALLGAVSIATAVESANIVGYLKTEATGKFFSSGPTFVECLSFLDTVNTPQWRLGDVKAENFNVYQDFISNLNPVSGAADLVAVYADEATAISWGDIAYVGWWDKATFDISLDGEMFDVSEGFLCNFANPVVLTYAGEVVTRPMTIDFTGLKFPLIANFVPKDGMKLGDLKVENFNVYQDFVSTLDPLTGNADIVAVYADEATAISWGDIAYVGWWDKATFDVPLDNTPLPAGAVLMGNFNSNVKFLFPSPL